MQVSLSWTLANDFIHILTQKCAVIDALTIPGLSQTSV